MSRFAKIPVQIPEKVQVIVQEGQVKVTGPKGTLERNLPSAVEVKIAENQVTVESKEVSKFGEAIKGTIKSHIANMVKGVTEGWSKKLEIVGTGYRAELKGADLVLTVGFSHPIIIKALPNIKFIIEKNVITVEGLDKEVVGEIAANMRAVRPPDPYKGKGMRYFGEVLKLKPGKQAAKTTA